MTRIAVVGNAPFQVDYTAEIDRADIVVRFNNAHGFGTNRGSRIDDLFLINCGGQALEWVQTDKFWKQQHVIASLRVTLPIAVRPDQKFAAWKAGEVPDDVDGMNFEAEIRARLDPMGKTVHTLSRKIYNEACQALAQSSSRQFSGVPSTGFLATFHYMNNAGQDNFIELFGFGFAGWQGHAWCHERAWVERQETVGKLIWHRPPSLG